MNGGMDGGVCASLGVWAPVSAPPSGMRSRSSGEQAQPGAHPEHPGPACHVPELQNGPREALGAGQSSRAPGKGMGSLMGTVRGPPTRSIPSHPERFLRGETREEGKQPRETRREGFPSAPNWFFLF